ncbi:transposase, partial [bacterium]|nr:transposase [bacterium]
VVDCRPVGSGERALKYLAPYIFRVAISNRRNTNTHESASCEISSGRCPILLQFRLQLRKRLPLISFVGF